MNNKVEIDGANYEIVKLERVEGQFQREDGNTIPYKKYYVYIKGVENPLVMRATIDKVFNDYVEYENE